MKKICRTCTLTINYKNTIQTVTSLSVWSTTQRIKVQYTIWIYIYNWLVYLNRALLAVYDVANVLAERPCSKFKHIFFYNRKRFHIFEFINIFWCPYYKDSFFLFFSVLCGWLKVYKWSKFQKFILVYVCSTKVKIQGRLKRKVKNTCIRASSLKRGIKGTLQGKCIKNEWAWEGRSYISIYLCPCLVLLRKWFYEWKLLFSHAIYLVQSSVLIFSLFFSKLAKVVWNRRRQTIWFLRVQCFSALLYFAKHWHRILTCRYM